MCRKVTTAKLTNTTELGIWGHGKQTGVFCYLVDCVEGLQEPMQSNFGQPLNLGRDRLIRINQLADSAADITETPIAKNHISGPQGVRGRNSENSRLRQVLGYQPEVSLEDGLTDAHAWIEAQVRNN